MVLCSIIYEGEGEVAFLGIKRGQRRNRADLMEHFHNDANSLELLPGT